MEEGGYILNNGDKEGNSPLISVITVCYNAELTIGQCVESVAEQSFGNIEHIIIDGASQDNTLSIIRSHENQIAYWRSEPDTGIYSAMNKALKYIRGKWVLFLGADDLLLPGFSRWPTYLKDERTLYYSKVLYDETPVGRKVGGYFLAKNNICHQSILYPKKTFEKYRFEEKYNLYADHHLNMQCWSDPYIKFEYCNILTARFAMDGASSKKNDTLFAQDKRKLIKKHFGFLTYGRFRFKEWKAKLKSTEAKG